MNKDVLTVTEALKPHSSVGVRGLVKQVARAPRGAEIVPEEMRLLSLAKEVPSFSVFGGEMSSLEKRLDVRAVDLRRDRAQATFTIQRTMPSSAREYLDEKGLHRGKDAETHFDCEKKGRPGSLPGYGKAFWNSTSWNNSVKSL